MENGDGQLAKNSFSFFSPERGENRRVRGLFVQGWPSRESLFLLGETISKPPIVNEATKFDSREDHWIIRHRAASCPAVSR